MGNPRCPTIARTPPASFTDDSTLKPASTIHIQATLYNWIASKPWELGPVITRRRSGGA